jgi:daunorubicin/doxorubicin transport system ATP-binding protein
MGSFNRSDRRPALAIEARGLTKSFGGTRALNGVDLAVPAATVYGFVGPNGAGKTTTIRILATLTRPDEGTATVLGHDVVRDPAAVRRLISLTSQFASLDQDLTGSENLVLLGRLLGLSWRRARGRAADLIDGFGLTGAAGRPVATLSGGMRRRLDIAASLIVSVDLLFLDEPTTGLDPRSRRDVWEIVKLIVGQGTTVLLTTQDLDEADQLAHRIAVVNHGRIIAEGTSGDLKAAIGAGQVRLRLRYPDQRPVATRILADALDAAVHADTDPRTLTAVVQADRDERLGRALLALGSAGVDVSDFSFGQPSLDDAFLALTEQPTSGTREEVRA